MVAESEEQSAQQEGQQGLQMIQPQLVPEIVHTLEWSDPDGNAGVCLLISNVTGQEYHFWPHDMGLQIASNVKKSCTGPRLVKVESALVLPPGARG